MQFLATSPLRSNTRRSQNDADAVTGGDPAPRSVLFSRYAGFVLFWNILVIALGAIVRATGSGDGCGSHWPLCDGQLIPLNPSIQRFIESTHRQVSELDGLLVMALVGGGLWMIRKRKHPIRWSLLASLAFTGVEAWIGKYLVNHHLVAHDQSPARAVWMSIHLVNTFFLLLSLTLTTWWASGGARLKLRGQGGIGLGFALAFLAMIALGVSGAITALGDTLFPAKNHADFVRQAEVGTHFLQQLRLIHAPLAGSVGMYLLLIAGLAGHFRPSPETRRWARGVGILFFLQIAVGGLNVWLLAPVWMQVIHLVMGDIVWVVTTLLACSALAVGVTQREQESYAPATEARATWRDYVTLTKPRVISLLLFTTLAAMFIARDATHHVTPWLFLAVAIGGYMSAGAANAINMVIDRDIDVRMARTAERPTVTQKVPSTHALMFGLGMAFGSYALIWWASNILAAMLALVGLVFYVVVYTLFLKRRTWHNIVIGGAAGAFPPLVGWAAVQGDLKHWLAWYLFAIVFVWTPAHFWALAILLKNDYAEAGVPMLPVVRSERMTVAQITMYSALTVIVSLLPAMQHLAGIGYVVAAVLLNAVLLGYTVKLWKCVDRPRASALFHYSMLYLALLFAAMAVDHVAGKA